MPEESPGHVRIKVTFWGESKRDRGAPRLVFDDGFAVGNGVVDVSADAELGLRGETEFFDSPMDVGRAIQRALKKARGL